MWAVQREEVTCVFCIQKNSTHHIFWTKFTTSLNWSVRPDEGLANDPKTAY